MKPIVFYLLQMFCASGLLYGYYHFFLRNKKFHQYNRFYLLASVLISLLVPFLNIPVYFSENSLENVYVLKTLEEFSVTASTPVAETDGFLSWPFWLQAVTVFYILATLVLITRIITSLLKIKRIIGKHQVEVLEGIHFLNTSEPGTPYSFFKWLFWNKKIALDSETGQQIFKHEVYHIKQQHSLDVLMMELLLIIGWVNPFFFLIKKELRTIHEFLADQYAMNETEDWEYAELLIKQALQTQTSLVNPFFHNQIKRRIAMITSSNKSSHQYLRKLMAIPIAVSAFLLFAFTYKKKEPATTPQLTLHQVDESSLPSLIDFQKNQPEQVITDTNPINKVTITEVPVSTDAPQKQKVDGTDPNPDQSVVEVRVTDPRAQQPLFLINGKVKTQEEFKKINPDMIESVSVWKDAEAIKRFGEKGKAGVVDIKLKPTNLHLSKKDTSVLREVAIDGSFFKTTEDKIFKEVEVSPMFKGGPTGWREYLIKNLNASTPVEHGAPAGMFTVFVQFIVHTDGSISDIKPLTNHGFGMENEVVRIIKEGPKWVPAVQNGNNVAAFIKQPVTFLVENDKPKSSNNNNSTGKIYPNPATQSAVLSVSSKFKGTGEILVYNNGGQLVTRSKHELSIGVNNLVIKTNSLNKGIYNVAVDLPSTAKKLSFQLVKD